MHVLSLVDGEKSVVELCHESEAGEGQTQKALYAFLCTGIVRARGRKVRALDQDFVPEDSLLALLDSFNRMYRHVLAYMVKEVGSKTNRRKVRSSSTAATMARAACAPAASAAAATSARRAVRFSIGASRPSCAASARHSKAMLAAETLNSVPCHGVPSRQASQATSAGGAKHDGPEQSQQSLDNLRH